MAVNTVTLAAALLLRIDSIFVDHRDRQVVIPAIPPCAIVNPALCPALCDCASKN